MDERGLKPQPSSEHWEGYFTFLRLLEGKSTEADRKKAKKAASVAPSRGESRCQVVRWAALTHKMPSEATPATKGTKGRPRKSLTFVRADEVEDEQDLDERKAKSRNVRARSKAKAKASDIDPGSELDQDEDEIESIADGSPAPALRARSRKNQVEEEEEEEEVKEEQPKPRQRRPRAAFKPIEEEPAEDGSEVDEELPEPAEILRPKAKGSNSELGKRKDLAFKGVSPDSSPEVPRKRTRIGD